jgi:hypothetical protein
VLVVAGIGGAAGCGKEIGDKCTAAVDCDPTGSERQCDLSSKDGYCTIQGCDFNTCPEEAVCVRFFTGSFTNRPCDPENEDKPQEDGTIPDACGFDELCSLAGNCVPRASEVRFCMRLCDGDDDCRDGYECRDRARMMAHGGEPVREPDVERDNDVKFCAIAPAAE